MSDLYVEACRELFLAYGTALEPAGLTVRASEAMRASLITLVGPVEDDIHLELILVVEDGLLAATHPAGAGPGAMVDLDDWCRELNNQLGGRLKNKLLAIGCDVLLGLGVPLDVPPVPTEDGLGGAFHSAKGTLDVRLAVRLGPGFRLQEPAALAAGETALAEGTHLLF